MAASSFLNKEGFGYDLLARYKEGGWLESFGRGAYVLPGDRVEWAGAVYALQKQLRLSVHPGGKTALELKGYAHYLPAQKTKIFLYAEPGLMLPAWLRGDRLGVELVVTRTRLFPPATGEGFSDLQDREFSVRISAPERAALEMLHLVPREVGFDEAFFIIENLVGLRPAVVQRLLHLCRFVKVRRLFMYMAEQHGHPWVQQLDLSRVQLGKGKRMVVAGGRLEPKYQITVPKETRRAEE